MEHTHESTREHCVYMDGVLHAEAEGRANWLAKWFALAHTARCEPCRRFLTQLKMLLSGLKRLGAEEPSAEEAQAVERLSKGEWRSKLDSMPD